MDKEDCADLGIIKVDLLGLGMMAVLEETIQIIRDDYHEEADLAHLPQDDATVYAALQQADTIGMFQIESRAQMSCLPRLRPTKFYDIVVQVAIIRPGQSSATCESLFRATPGPRAGEVRASGFGAGVEAHTRRASVSGATAEDGDDLRRFHWWRGRRVAARDGLQTIRQRMKEIEIKLRRGMTKKGITGRTQDEIVEQIASFALYGFPESHAASFALIAYASAYLKCHYLAAFTAATLNNQPMGFYHHSRSLRTRSVMD